MKHKTARVRATPAIVTRAVSSVYLDTRLDVPDKVHWKQNTYP
jgi:hypothetical protein